MDYIETDSVPGSYGTYRDGAENTYIVLDNLSVADVATPSWLGQVTQTYYHEMAIGYWLLFVVSLLYLVSTYILVPLLMRFRRSVTVRPFVSMLRSR